MQMRRHSLWTAAMPRRVKLAVATIGLDVAEDGLDDDFVALEGSAWIWLGQLVVHGPAHHGGLKGFAADMGEHRVDPAGRRAELISGGSGRSPLGRGLR